MDTIERFDRYLGHLGTCEMWLKDLVIQTGTQV